MQPEQSSLDEQLKKQTQVRQSQVGTYVAIALASVLLVATGIGAYYFTTLEVQQQTSTPTEAAGSAVEANEQHREQAQQAILAYEQQYQPLLARSQIQSFAPAKHQQATQAYELALQAFAQSQFREVETHLKHSIAMAEKLQKHWLEAADSWYQQAEQALTQQRPQEAQLYVQKLTAVNDQDTRIKELQQRIDGFAQQQHWWRVYQGALAERDVPKQVTALQQLVQVQPNRDELKQKLAAAQESLRQNQLSAAVEQAQQALQQQQLQHAQQAISRIAQLQGDKNTLALLKAQLAKQQRQLSTEQTRALLLQASEQQQWQQVIQLAEQYLQQAPGDSTITALAARGREVLAAKQKLNVYLTRPQRLSDSSVRAQAEQVLTRAQPLKPYSRDLARGIDTLRAHLKEMSTPVQITLLSDGETQVRIFGVERLGEFTEKTLPLLPGSYTIEGRRSGYVTVKEKLIVNSDSHSVSLTIACTKRI